MSTQDKLVEALRVAREWLNSDKWRNSTIDKHKSWKAMMRGIDAALAEYDARGAEAAQAQAQGGEWVGRKRKGHTEWRQGTEKDGGGSTNYVEPVWVWDEPELFDQWMDRDWPLWRNDPDNPNVARLRRMYDTLAAQENPNG